MFALARPGEFDCCHLKFEGSSEVCWDNCERSLKTARRGLLGHPGGLFGRRNYDFRPASFGNPSILGRLNHRTVLAMIADGSGRSVAIYGS